MRDDAFRSPSSRWQVLEGSVVQIQYEAYGVLFDRRQAHRIEIHAVPQGGTPAIMGRPDSQHSRAGLDTYRPARAGLQDSENPGTSGGLKPCGVRHTSYSKQDGSRVSPKVDRGIQ